MDTNKESALALEVYKQIKSETKIPCMRFELTDTKPSIFESKVGGMGYVPHDEKIPQDKDGNQLKLLAQIECEKVELEEFPKKGLLQFWIADADLYGMDFDNPTNQNGFRVIYYENVDTSVTEDEVKSKTIESDEEVFLPIEGEFGITFTKSYDGLSISDYKFEDIFVEKYNSLNPEEEIEAYWDVDTELIEEEEEKSPDGFGHKISGYPAFTQSDPRENGEFDEYGFLLFQLDSDFGGGNDKVLWGDAGVGNFFINKEKLKRLDFSDVLYNWDCY